MPSRSTAALTGQFGQIDIYLFDQLLKGRLAPGMRVLDAGCGGGRNLVFLLRQGFDVHGVDRGESALEEVLRLAARLAPGLPPGNFRREPVEALSFPDETFDFVISSAVLHFAPDVHTFRRMVEEMWRVLAPGGVLFARLASTIGIEELVRPLGGRRYLLPDGTERFLVDAPMLIALGTDLGAELLDPIKTTLVHEQRSMTTWVLGKKAR